MRQPRPGKSQRRRLVKPLTLLVTVTSMVVLMQGTALAHHQVPPGQGLVEFPAPLTCEGVETTMVVTPAELIAPSLGPGWSTDVGMAIPISLTFFDDGNVILVITNGNKTAKGLEHGTCTGPAILPDGQLVDAAFEVVFLP